MNIGYFYVLHLLYGWAIAHHIIFYRIIIFPNLHLRYQMSKDWPKFGAVVIKSITVKKVSVFSILTLFLNYII